MKKYIFLIAAAFVALIGFFGYLCGKDVCGLFAEEQRPPDNSEKRKKPVETNMIKVSEPLPDTLVKSPLTVKGEARGNWYFEASFPARLVDANGIELARLPVQAKGEWMTTEFVPFETLVPFSLPTAKTGTLILQKDNPSGLPEHDESVSVPVRFAEYDESKAARATRTAALFYYNPNKDKDSEGNILCSRKGLVAVERRMPVSQTPIQDTIRLLLAGALNADERAQGITTEYPLPGVELKAASLRNGILTLTFDDPENRTGGGSCRAGILWFQIEATAKQFSGVNEVRFSPEYLFQP